MKFKNEDASEASIRVPQNSVKCCKMLQNAAKCRKMPQNAAKCRKCKNYIWCENSKSEEL